MERFWKYKLDHWIFWIATIGFHAFTRVELMHRAGVGQFLLEITLRNILLASVIYINLLVLIPRLLQAGKYGLYIMLLMLTLAGYVAGKNAHDVYLYGTVLDDEIQRNFLHNSFYNFSIVLFYLMFSVAMQLSKEWYFQKELIRKIEIEKLNTELDYLRAQVNPHFLFNSINTIYFQIEKENTGARETLMALSDMLRYQLYECNGREVPIEKEIAYLKNYTELQRMRENETSSISFTTTDNLTGFSIVPLLLIPFVENAFKHLSHFSSEVNEIRIHFSRNGAQFRAHFFNTRDGQPKGMGNIGLKNVRRRLDLLYPDRHRLSVQETGKTFEMELLLSIA